jgi:RND family efflux transporter MFP subunit
MPKQLFTRYLLPATALGLFVFTVHSVAAQQDRQTTEPRLTVAAAPFADAVAGTGIIEPQSETIAIGTSIAGIVKTVHVKVGDSVAAGAPLFTIDDRQTLAEQAQLTDELKVAEQELADAEDQLSRANRLTKGLAIGESALERLRFAARTARANVVARRSALREAETTLDRLTVRAPIAGTVLRVNLHPGEFAPTGALAAPLMTVGDITTLHVRVEVDETLIHRITTDTEAVGSLRGVPDAQIPLRFVRFEPALVSKRSLSGNSAELVDTRVLEALYAFDPATTPGAFVGQQMDVFLKGKPIAWRQATTVEHSSKN